MSLALGFCVGHVDFIFFVLISFALGSRRKRSFQWSCEAHPRLHPESKYDQLHLQDTSQDLAGVIGIPVPDLYMINTIILAYIDKGMKKMNILLNF